MPKEYVIISRRQCSGNLSKDVHPLHPLLWQDPLCSRSPPLTLAGPPSVIGAPTNSGRTPSVVGAPH